MAASSQGEVRLAAPDLPQEARWASQDAASWWKVPRHPRPVYAGDEAEARGVAMGLQSAVANAPKRQAVALAHVIWAAASWARREPGAGHTRVQVASTYVQSGAMVARRTAEAALALYRKRTAAEPAGAGWLRLSAAGLEGSWRALGWLLDLGLVSPPQVAPSALVPLFLVPLVDQRRGNARCGCPVHRRGDQVPSLLFDLERGVGTCMVSREVFILQEDVAGVWACRVVRGEEFSADHLAELTVTKDTPLEGPAGDEPVQLPHARDLDRAGRPGPDPRCPGIVTGRLWPSGLSRTLSQAKSREAWVKWQARRWGGSTGLSEAWTELAHQETGGRARGWGPDRLVGVGWWRPSAVTWMAGKTGRLWPVLHLEERGTGHVLFDVDHLVDVPVNPSPELLAKVLAAVSDIGLLERPAWVIRTSSKGLQVLVKLRAFRWDPVGFYRSPNVQRFLRFAGARLVEALGGGTLDVSAFAPQRFGRAPGWRVKAGDVQLAALWWSAPPEPRENG